VLQRHETLKHNYYRNICMWCFSRFCFCKL